MPVTIVGADKDAGPGADTPVRRVLDRGAAGRADAAGYPADEADGGSVLGPYHLHVDGRLRTVADAWLGDSLLTVLRDRLGVTGVKDGCEQGRCGSCSVLLDGRLVASCATLAADAVDARVTTLAGLPADGPAPAVQAAFLRHGAVQCGFCTPGFVVAVTDLLSRRPDATEDEVREALAGNICRCTGYGRIIAAVRAVQTDLATAGPPPTREAAREAAGEAAPRDRQGEP